MAITAWLALNRAWRLVMWWILLFIGGMGVVVATKIAFVGWGLGIRSLNFTGFSGHAMRATAVAPVFFYMLLEKSPRIYKIAGVIAGLAFGILISYSRLVVHAHSVSEAVTGFLLGGAVALVFIGIIDRYRLELNSWIIVLSVAVLLASPAIPPAPTQRWITKTALYLSGHSSPYTRANWSKHNDLF
ncbi:MAG: phosphatase PAP2 family protein [Burkholderiales bacterium]